MLTTLCLSAKLTDFEPTPDCLFSAWDLGEAEFYLSTQSGPTHFHERPVVGIS